MQEAGNIESQQFSLSLLGRAAVQSLEAGPAAAAVGGAQESGAGRGLLRDGQHQQGSGVAGGVAVLEI